EYLPAGSREVNAVVTINATEGTGAGTDRPVAPTGEVVEVIIVDCSGSMAYPRTKIAGARQATKAALDTLRDGVRFAVIQGTGRPGPPRLPPPRPGPRPPPHPPRRDAKRAVDRLEPNGGTAIGRWLRKADELFAAYPGALRHAILLTDGKDESETPQELDDAI